MTATNQLLEESVRRQLLTKLLEETKPAAWNELYIRHGAPISEEVPFLAEKAQRGGEKVRRNAARLLALSPTVEAKTALRKLVAETEDAVVFGRALAGLPGEPGARELVAARPKLLEQALRSADPEAAAAAVRAARLVGLSTADPELQRRLLDPDFHVRSATLETLAEQGAGALEPKLCELLLSDPQNLFLSKLNVYRALAQSSDTETADVFRQSLVGAKTERVLDFVNGVQMSQSRQPWLRQLLLELSATEGHPARWPSLDQLWRWSDPTTQQELARLCLTQLEKRLPAERSDKLINDNELDTCVAKLNKFVGHEYSFRELFELRDAARARLLPGSAVPTGKEPA